MYNTSKGYKEKVLEDSTQHELNIYIDENKIEPNHIIDFSSTSELFNNNEFCLGCTPERDIEFEIDKRDLPETYNEVYAETGIKYHEDIVTEGEELTLKEEKEIPLNMEISGNREQETRSGKNKIDFTNYQSFTASNVYYAIKANQIDLNSTDIYKFIYSATGDFSLKNDMVLWFRDTNNTSFKEVTLNEQFALTDEEIEKLSYIQVVVRGLTSGNTYKGYIYPRILLSDETDTSYEPYGVSPSPNYPSKIKCCGDNINIFPKGSDFTNEGSKISFDDESNTYTVETSENWKRYTYTGLKSGENIAISFDIKSDSSALIGQCFRIDNSSGAIIANNEKDYTENEFKRYYYIVTVPSNGIITLNMRNNLGIKYYIKDIKIEEGTVVTPYSPYGQGSVKVTKCNKNFVKVTGKTTTKNGVTYTFNDDNTISLNGINTLTSGYDAIDVGEMEIITDGTYHLSGGISSLITLQLYTSDWKVDIKDVGNGKNANLTSGKYRLRLVVTNKSNCNNINILPQLELGLDKTDYKYHQEQSYIMPVQQEMLEEDYFNFDNEEEVHSWKKLVLNGTEEWQMGTINDLNFFIIKMTLPDFKYINDNTCNYICNTFEAIKVNNRWLNNSIYISANKLITITSNDFTSISGLKSYLTTQYTNGTPVIVYYKLSTPMRLPFTEEQKAVAKELTYATTYEGTTHIYSTDEIKPKLKTTVGSEIVPIGQFIIQKPIEDDEFKVKIKATDYMKKFEDINYDGSNLTSPKTMLEVLKDICEKVGVELGSTSFLNSDKQIAVYDNTVTARTYLGYIAEQAGRFAVIGRDGKLYIKTFGENIADFDIDLFGDFKWGDKFKISKVSYEDGIQDYKFGDETQATVYIDKNNMYIVDREQVENIYNQIKDFEIYTFEGETIIDPAYDIGDILIIDGKRVLYQGEMKYAGKFKANIKNKVQAKTEQESMQTKQSNSNKIKRVQSEINQIDGKITQLVQETSEHEEKLTQAQQDIEGFTQKVATKDELTEKVNEIKHTIDNITLQQQTKGGGNIFFYAKEYWKGSTDNSTATLEEYTHTLIQQNNISDEGYLINKGVSIQSQVVKNGQYVISFNYYKLKADATGYVKINEIEYKLDGNVNIWTEKIIPIEVTSNNIKIEIGSDTDASFYIADLMVAVGTEKSVWTQNANETRTDTVEIGKGIQVNSSTKNTYTRIDADGNRTFNSSTNERVAEMTDKGVYTKQLEVKEQAIINSLLIQNVGGQIWITGIGG